MTAACGSGDLPKLPGQVAANGEKAMAAGTADMSMMANVEYRLADGVTIDVDKGKAYRFDKVDENDVKKLADALGVTGPIKSDEYGYTVGSDTTLYVGKEGTFSMSQAYPASAGGSSSSVAPDGVVSSDDTPPSTVPPASAASEANARKVAKALFDKLGIDTDHATVMTSGDSNSVTVSFKPNLDGKPVDGYELFATVGADGKITSASGQATSPKSAGTYGLATLQRAVERLNEQTGQYRTLEDAVTPGAADSAAVGSAPVDSVGGESPIVITLTKATAGLMLQNDSDNQMWLVPAYVFETSDGGQVVAQAAEDKYIQQPQTETSTPNNATVDPGATEPAPPQNCTIIDDSSGIGGQVCASAANVKVGDTVTFTIDMGDSDRAFEEGCADGVKATYGDGGDGDVSCLACQTTLADGGGKASRKRTHTYNTAGSFTAEFVLKSGLSCGPANPADSTATVRIPITVA